MKRTRRLPPVFWCLVIAAILPSPVVGQCTGGRCVPASTPHPAVVRVAQIGPGGSRCYGSGTLIYKDAEKGIVLTCAHLFRGQTGSVVVTFPEGDRLDADLLAVDQAWDLAAMKIAPPRATSVTVATDPPKPGDRLQSCGYGFDGRYWCNQGRTLGYARTATTATHETLELSGYARDGDSGGPVFNERGELVAVLWGTDGRIVGGTYCGRIRKFLAGIFSPGRLPRQPPGPAPLAPELPPSEPSPPALPVVDDPWDKIRERLEGLAGQLDDAKQQQAQHEQSWGRRMENAEKAVALVAGLKDRLEKAENAVESGNLRAVVREVASGIVADRAPGLVQTLLPAVLAALGWTGPPSLAAIFAIRLVAAILKRRAAKRRRRVSGGTRDQPKPLNDDYAEQLTQVYALSGRSPIADATLGREYDEELRRTEQESDAALARWARTLRERVARRFYRIHDESPVPSDPPSQAE